MGTGLQMVSYTSREHSRVELTRAMEAAYVEIERLNGLLSSWTHTSDVGRVNDAEGRPISISAETAEVLERALWTSRVSEGAFDVTFEITSDLWRFGDAAENPPRLPAPVDIARRRGLIDYRRLEFRERERTVVLPKGMRMSLDGIAKGYIVDRAARVLTSRGLTSFFLRAGGDLLSVGRKPNGEEWSAGVQDPRGPADSYFATLDFSDHAFSTAGDYARAYLSKGRRYHHIIDPRTGSPATACRSVTVWAPDALTADALDDAVFVLGPERGLALVESQPGVGAVIVDATGRVHVSERLRHRLTVLREPTNAP
jgi:thiamine biosynthesis lipoprotein